MLEFFWGGGGGCMKFELSEIFYNVALKVVWFLILDIEKVEFMMEESVIHRMVFFKRLSIIAVAI